MTRCPVLEYAHSMGNAAGNLIDNLMVGSLGELELNAVGVSVQNPVRVRVGIAQCLEKPARRKSFLADTSPTHRGL